MTTLHTIHHKKNEIQEDEFYKDKECTEAFDFTNAKNLYIQPINGDCTPIFALSNKLSGLGIKARIFTPIWHLGWGDGISPQTPLVTLNDVLDCEDSNNVNLSKYIPEDNAVLFLSEEGYKRHKDCFIEKYADNFLKKLGFLIEGGYDTIYSTRPFVYDKDLDFGLTKPHPKTRDVCWRVTQTKNITIFLTHGTQSEIQKVNEVCKYLWANFGIKPNLCVLHSFLKYIDFTRSSYLCDLGFENKWNINKIITTNSTGILKLEDSNERLQIIDAKEIFEDSLKTQF